MQDKLRQQQSAVNRRDLILYTTTPCFADYKSIERTGVPTPISFDIPSRSLVHELPAWITIQANAPRQLSHQQNFHKSGAGKNGIRLMVLISTNFSEYKTSNSNLHFKKIILQPPIFSDMFLWIVGIFHTREHMTRIVSCSFNATLRTWNGKKTRNTYWGQLIQGEAEYSSAAEKLNQNHLIELIFHFIGQLYYLAMMLQAIVCTNFHVVLQILLV